MFCCKRDHSIKVTTVCLVIEPIGIAVVAMSQWPNKRATFSIYSPYNYKVRLTSHVKLEKEINNYITYFADAIKTRIYKATGNQLSNLGFYRSSCVQIQ
jgi:hypothetical protein